MKKAFISILFLFFIKTAVAQYIPGDDECYIVLEKLKQNLKNDSLVVDFFVKNYPLLHRICSANADVLQTMLARICNPCLCLPCPYGYAPKLAVASADL